MASIGVRFFGLLCISLIWGKIFLGFSIFFLFLVDFNYLVGEKVWERTRNFFSILVIF